MPWSGQMLKNPCEASPCIPNKIITLNVRHTIVICKPERIIKLFTKAYHILKNRCSAGNISLVIFLCRIVIHNPVKYYV